MLGRDPILENLQLKCVFRPETVQRERLTESGRVEVTRAVPSRAI